MAVTTYTVSAHFADDGFVYVILPSENRALRQYTEQAGVAVKAHRPAYRFTVQGWDEFVPIARDIYPRWTFEKRTGEVPPWVQTAMTALARESAARKESMRTEDL